MRAAWLLFLAAAPSAACTEAARGPLAGASDAWSSAPQSVPAASAPRRVWDGYAEAQRWPRANAAPFTSQGHPPAQAVDVHGNELASASYAALVTDTVFPDGAALAELSHAGTGHGYVMRKVGGSWTYAELDARGSVLASGALTLCAGCHAQATSDSVFGLPRLP